MSEINDLRLVSPINSYYELLHKLMVNLGTTTSLDDGEESWRLMRTILAVGMGWNYDRNINPLGCSLDSLGGKLWSAWVDMDVCETGGVLVEDPVELRLRIEAAKDLCLEYVKSVFDEFTFPKKEETS